MKAFGMQLAAALDAIEIESPDRAWWLGDPIPLVAGPGERARGLPLLAGNLAMLLYHHFYATGAPEPRLRREGPASTARERAEFGARLACAAPTATVVEPGWEWVRRDRRGITVRRSGVMFTAPESAALPPEASGAREGDQVRVRAPFVRFGASLGHAVLFAPPRSREIRQGSRVRLYWNVTASQAPRLLATLAEGLTRRHVPYVIKTLADPQSYSRCDATLLILDRDDYSRMAPTLAETAADGGAWSRSDRVPALTRPLAPGLGFADAPADGESFGLHRCRLIASAVVESFRRGECDLSSRLEALRGRFTAAGVDPEKPYLHANSADLRPLPRPARVRTTGSVWRSSGTGVPVADLAGSIARALCGRALCHGRFCTWLDPAPEGATPRSRPGSVRLAPLGPDLYGGTAGVALFLAHWAHRSGDARARRTALGALRQAVAEAGDRAWAVGGGFHAGWPGVAWSAAHVGLLLDEEELVAAARALLRRRGGEKLARGEHDILTGTAGSILALLLLADLLESPESRERASALGEALIRAGKRVESRRSWPSPGHPTSGDLTGLSHGAAGVAHALLELYRATGKSSFRRAAMEGIRYERHLFDQSEGNWPDLRLWDARAPRRVRPRFMVAWCHGAGGIGLARLHVWMATRDPVARDEVRCALRAVRRALKGHLGDRLEEQSLCHGAAGLVLFLLDAKEAGLSHPLDKALIQQAADRWRALGGLEEGGRRPGGSAGLFLGSSGVGYAALRIAGQVSPSILLPSLTTESSPQSCR